MSLAVSYSERDSSLFVGLHFPVLVSLTRLSCKSLNNLDLLRRANLLQHRAPRGDHEPAVPGRRPYVCAHCNKEVPGVSRHYHDSTHKGTARIFLDGDYITLIRADDGKFHCPRPECRSASISSWHMGVSPDIAICQVRNLKKHVLIETLEGLFSFP